MSLNEFVTIHCNDEIIKNTLCMRMRDKHMPCYGHYDKHNEVPYIVYHCKEEKLQEIKNTKVLYSTGGGRVIYANENAVLEPNEGLMEHLHSAFDESNKVNGAYITPTEFWWFTPETK